MKSIMMMIAIMLSASSFASDLEGVPENLCPEINIDFRKDVATCKASNATAVLNAKVSTKLSTEEYKALKFYTSDAIELGIIPDADSNNSYFYFNWLVDGSGKRVGIKTINGWYNEEMGLSGRVDVLYNLKGQIVKIDIK